MYKGVVVHLRRALTKQNAYVQWVGLITVVATFFMSRLRKSVGLALRRGTLKASTQGTIPIRPNIGTSAMPRVSRAWFLPVTQDIDFKRALTHDDGDIGFDPGLPHLAVSTVQLSKHPVKESRARCR